MATHDSNVFEEILDKKNSSKDVLLIRLTGLRRGWKNFRNWVLENIFSVKAARTKSLVSGSSRETEPDPESDRESNMCSASRRRKSRR